MFYFKQVYYIYNDKIIIIYFILCICILNGAPKWTFIKTKTIRILHRIGMTLLQNNGKQIEKDIIIYNRPVAIEKSR